MHDDDDDDDDDDDTCILYSLCSIACVEFKAE